MPSTRNIWFCNVITNDSSFSVTSLMHLKANTNKMQIPGVNSRIMLSMHPPRPFMGCKTSLWSYKGDFFFWNFRSPANKDGYLKMSIVTKECFNYSSFVKHFYSSKSSLNSLWYTTGHCSSQDCCTLTCSYVLCTTLSFFFIRLENPFVAVELSGFLMPLNMKNCSFESGWLGSDLLLVIQLNLVWVILTWS